MNRITITHRDGNPRHEVLIDDRRLAEYFVGRNGAHPSQVLSIGWANAQKSEERASIEQLLGSKPSALSSGRVPVLVCEECGDVACGTLAVRIERRDGVITWTDWAYENGYEPPSELAWPTYPEVFEFDASEYERAFANVASEG